MLIRISTSLDDDPCFLTFYNHDPYWLQNCCFPYTCTNQTRLDLWMESTYFVSNGILLWFVQCIYLYSVIWPSILLLGVYVRPLFALTVPLYVLRRVTETCLCAGFFTAKAFFKLFGKFRIFSHVERYSIPPTSYIAFSFHRMVYSSLFPFIV